MSEQQTTGRPRPELRGKVEAVLPEWRNNSGTFWKQEIIDETGYRYPSPIKVTFQKEGTSHLEGIAEGDCVIIPYVLNGRRWDGPNGTQYYVDVVGMGLQKIEASGGGAAKKPVLGCTAATAIEAWAKNHGDDKAGFAAFCMALKPGKASKTYTIKDWADVVNAIDKADKEAEAAENAAGDANAAGEDFVSDLPF